ncbi:PilZ domain-containing protein [Desulfovibrio inopinatus]|uniref:PilZ domain-containing protein n=1 Tax=Desulfovibrio inopinatus TaxID=102109 RepID=UPI000403D47E|nr:PilZ domain-containing protein [Desulfovibrio inopinatus]
MKLLLVSGPGEARNAFLRELTSFADVEVECVAHPDEIESVLTNESVSGILFNIATMVREKNYNKRRIIEFTEMYPVVRLRYNLQAGTVHVLHYDQIVEREDTLRRFVLEECASFTARPLRQRERVRAYFHVFVYTDSELGNEAGERACTLNLSGLGCYIVTCVEHSVGQIVWLKFMDHPDVPAISSKVVWRKPWGEGVGLPGLGLMFLNLKPEQTELVETLIKSSASYRQK